MPEHRLARTRAAYQPSKPLTLYEQYLRGTISVCDGFDWCPPALTRWARIKAWFWRLTHRARPITGNHWCVTLDDDWNAYRHYRKSPKTPPPVDAHLGATEE